MNEPSVPDRRVFPDKAVDVALAEFNAVRALIGVRFQLQVTLLVAALTAVGVLAGFVLEADDDRSLLLLVPVLASSMSLLYSEQARRIILMGEYINKSLWPYLNCLTRSEVPSWEAHWDAQVANRGRHLLLALGDLPPVMLLGGVSALSLGVMWCDNATNTTGGQFLWWLGFVLTGSSLVPVVLGVKRGRRAARFKPGGDSNSLESPACSDTLETTTL